MDNEQYSSGQVFLSNSDVARSITNQTKMKCDNDLIMELFDMIKLKPLSQ
jgi:hypothetical protein